MTERILKTSIGNREVLVSMGWDRPLQYHFMVIKYSNLDIDPIYSNLDDDKSDFQGSLVYFSKKARSFGIEIPPSMLARLRMDETLNIGNDKSVFDDYGSETQVKTD